MKYILPFSVLASPALAHSETHIHPHGAEGWIIAFLLLMGLSLVLWVRR